MAELENQVDETQYEDETTDYTETTDNSEEEVTYDDYLALKERLRKAESKVVEYKKKEKEAPKTVKTAVDTEMRLFLVENPDAKDYKEKILELKAVPKYQHLDLEDLLDLAKLKTPLESKTKTDYDFKSISKPKSLETMSEEEAIEKLSPSDFLKWSRANGYKG